ncbi:MAG: BrnA antitoxin family protein [Edaphobacter sp.]
MKPTPIKGRPGVVSFRREPGTPLTKRERAEIEKLVRMPEHEIDTSDIPEWSDEMWKRAVRGRFYRPIKKAVSLRLDADVIAWLKKDGKGYQTRANRVLREKMLAEKAS